MTTSTSFSARNESIKLSLLLSILCLSILYGDWVWRWDRLIYDAQSSAIRHEANDDIVIIAIDEASLNTLGRWPWPRNIHAQLINKLTEYQAKAVLIDVIFSESTLNSQDDQILAQAIEKNGRVILPVLLEQTRLRGQLLETLPLPILTKAAASIGHVHIELDPDGIARGSYLFEGLGEARWPHIGLATLQMLNEVEVKPIDDEHRNNENINSQWSWIRKHHFLIPYVGPPGSFRTTSYINVLNDEILTATLKDKIILVGVTAAGLGDSLPTPVSGLARAMPGIEINANIIQAIKNNSLIKTISPTMHYFLAAALVMLPILLFPYLSPRLTLILVTAEVTLILLSSLLLLHVFHIWFPISATLITLLLAYPLWAWRRLEFTVKYLDSELETLSKEASEIQHFVALDIGQSFNSLKSLLPIKGIGLYKKNSENIFSIGDVFECVTNNSLTNEWSVSSKNIYARNIIINDVLYIACIYWNTTSPPTEEQTKIIKNYIRQHIKPIKKNSKTTVELIESRIRDIQETTDKLSYLRNFITDSLEQMADGVIVVDSLGVITLANQQAGNQLGVSTSLLHQPISNITNTLTLISGETWDDVINDLLLNKRYENLQVQTVKKQDLIINVSPLYKSDKSIIGFIINLSDITEIKNSERKRNETLSFLSHDLRSPLVSVLAMLEKTKLSNHENPLNIAIENNINHTIQLAEDFVHLSRIESNDNINLIPIDMSDIIANAVDTVWAQADIKSILIKQHINTNAWTYGNGSILERIIINLLTNSIKYSDKNRNINITLDKNENSVVCCIEDSGFGIEENALTQIFNRFNRIEQSIHTSNNERTRKEKGIGLGLAFVHAAVKRHHGIINIKSTIDKGTTVCISLPEYLEKNAETK